MLHIKGFVPILINIKRHTNKFFARQPSGPLGMLEGIETSHIELKDAMTIEELVQMFPMAVGSILCCSPFRFVRYVEQQSFQHCDLLFCRLLGIIDHCRVSIKRHVEPAAVLIESG